jgi:predicted nucleotidyltransferase
MVFYSENKTDQDKIIIICRQNDISMIAIFGSTARGEANESSDTDLLVLKNQVVKILQDLGA